MKTNVLSVITSKEEAENYLQALLDNNEGYHPEDDAQDIIFNFEVSAEECKQMNMRMEEVFYFITDPCAFVIKRLAIMHNQSYTNFNDKFEGQDPEYYNDLLDDVYTHPKDVL